MIFFSDTSNTVKVGDFHESRIADENDFWLFFEDGALEFFIVDIAVFVDAIANKIVDVGRAGDG